MTKINCKSLKPQYLEDTYLETRFKKTLIYQRFRCPSFTLWNSGQRTRSIIVYPATTLLVIIFYEKRRWFYQYLQITPSKVFFNVKLIHVKKTFLWYIIKRNKEYKMLSFADYLTIKLTRNILLSIEPAGMGL